MGWQADITGLDDLDRDWADACSALSDGAQRGVAMAVAEGAAEARTVHRYRDRTGALTASTVGRVEVSTKGGAEGIIEATKSYAPDFAKQVGFSEYLEYTPMSALNGTPGYSAINQFSNVRPMNGAFSNSSAFPADAWGR